MDKQKPKPKHYYGEECERVTWRDCQAANMLTAKLRAGQVDPDSIVVAAPRAPLATLVQQ